MQTSAYVAAPHVVLKARLWRGPLPIEDNGEREKKAASPLRLYLYFPSKSGRRPVSLPSLSTSGRFMLKVVSGVTTAYSM